jgi:hypothetical protein
MYLCSRSTFQSPCTQNNMEFHRSSSCKTLVLLFCFESLRQSRNYTFLEHLFLLPTTPEPDTVQIYVGDTTTSPSVTNSSLQFCPRCMHWAYAWYGGGILLLKGPCDGLGMSVWGTLWWTALSMSSYGLLCALLAPVSTSVPQNGKGNDMTRNTQDIRTDQFWCKSIAKLTSSEWTHRRWRG